MDDFVKEIYKEIYNLFGNNKSPKELKLEKHYEEIVNLIYDIFYNMETVTPQLPKRFELFKNEENTIYVYDSSKNVLCSEDNIQAALFEAKEAVKFKKLFQERVDKIDNQLRKMNNTNVISNNLSSLNQGIQILKNNQKQDIKDINSIKQDIEYLLNHQNRQKEIPDYTDDLCNLLEKIDNLEKKINNVDNAIDRNKNLIRDIRDSNDDDSAYKEDMKRKVNNIVGQYALLKDEIAKLNVAKQEPESQEDKKEELHIINPDRELLKDMYETSQKLNEMIYQTAMALSKNENSESLQEDVNNQNQQINEDSKDEDIKENGDINNQEQKEESLKKFEDEENKDDEIKESDF